MAKYSFVIGNPPYQMSVGKTDSQTQGNSNWVFPAFQDVADSIAEKGSCLIYPFGGWFDAPERMHGFGHKIMTDGHTASIAAYEGTDDRRAWYRTDKNPEPVFGHNANLSAGVAIVCRSTETHESFKYSNRVYSDKAVEIKAAEADNLSPNPEFDSIRAKINGKKLNTSVKKGIFGIESDFVEKNPDKVSQNKSDWEHPVHILTNDRSGSSGRATWFWIDEDNIPTGHDYLGRYKVITTSAYPKQKFSSGKPTLQNVHERLGELIELLPPGTAFGRSRMLLFASDHEEECRNFIRYTQTKFFAGLTLQEPNRCSSFGFIIPLQDFTDSSDIDWAKTVPEIDRQLYQKYGLSDDEIRFVENRVKDEE